MSGSTMYKRQWPNLGMAHRNAAPEGTEDGAASAPLLGGAHRRPAAMDEVCLIFGCKCSWRVMLEGDAALAAAAACPCMIVMSAEKHTHLFVGQFVQDKKTWCHFALYFCWVLGWAVPASAARLFQMHHFA